MGIIYQLSLLWTNVLYVIKLIIVHNIYNSAHLLNCILYKKQSVNNHFTQLVIKYIWMFKKKTEYICLCFNYTYDKHVVSLSFITNLLMFLDELHKIYMKWKRHNSIYYLIYLLIETEKNTTSMNIMNHNFGITS